MTIYLVDTFSPFIQFAVLLFSFDYGTVIPERTKQMKLFDTYRFRRKKSFGDREKKRDMHFHCNNDMFTAHSKIKRGFEQRASKPIGRKRERNESKSDKFIRH